MKTDYIFIIIGVIVLTFILWLATLTAVAYEVSNRAATRLRQQLKIDKKRMLKLPEIQRQTRTQDCQLSNSDIRCMAYSKGKQMMVVTK